MIGARVICDSVSPDGVRLTTLEVTLHRFVLAELNTHRAFSRNSASSRAVPVRKQLERVQSDPVLPVFWGKNRPGMAAVEELGPAEARVAEAKWLEARDAAVRYAEDLVALGLHKQLANRLLEPFLWHTVIVSSTDWANFFAQRLACDPATGLPCAQPEMYEVARVVQSARAHSVPREVGWDDWHLPYIGPEDALAVVHPDDLRLVSAARCARVSYLTHDGRRDVAEDLRLAGRLIAAEPMHASPFEHVATPARGPARGNFRGWHQLRHEFAKESARE